MATSAGAFLAMAPWSVLLALASWVGVVFTSRIVSLGSLTAAVVLSVSLFFLPHQGGVALEIFTLALAAFVFWAHRSNIGRLRRGEENRFGKKGSEAKAAGGGAGEGNRAAGEDPS
jgi:glycerol-3-phosphate acyltransferase PlsY